MAYNALVGVSKFLTLFCVCKFLFNIVSRHVVIGETAGEVSDEIVSCLTFHKLPHIIAQFNQRQPETELNASGPKRPEITTTYVNNQLCYNQQLLQSADDSAVSYFVGSHH